MKPSVTRTKGQVYSVGNYLMTGKVLGKGHFAKVEEATHRIIGKKVAIKIIDLTCIKEEYARRNLHREPKVMARLRHPCIAALYETMMHGPRLYVVMEAAGGGDLCAHVLSARGAAGARGLPETRARHLSVQLVSAVKHMHASGVVHRDLKMENIMLDSTKQFIKIVDFGLSNVWSAHGGLRTPCGSLEYAAPELFLDGRRYGPEVDLWSVGVIVYGMVTGSLPFGGAAGNCAGGEGSGRSRPQLRAAIARGFSRKHKAALAQLSAECKIFVQQLLEPIVENRLKIEEAARHRWLRKPGLRLQAYPLPELELKNTRLIARQISELSGQTLTDVIAEIKVDPYGSVGGMFNIKQHLAQLAGCGPDPLWGPTDSLARPPSPPVYQPHASTLFKHSVQTSTSPSLRHSPALFAPPNQAPLKQILPSAAYKQTPTPPLKLGLVSSTICKTVQPALINPYKALQPMQNNFSSYKTLQHTSSVCKKDSSQINSAVYKPKPPTTLSNMGNKHTPAYKSQPSSPQTLYKACGPKAYTTPVVPTLLYKKTPTCSPECNPTSGFRSLPASPSYNNQSPSNFRAVTAKFRVPPLGVRKSTYKVHDNGDGVEPRLPSIDEHGNLNTQEDFPRMKARAEEDRLRLSSCPDRSERRTEFYRRAGDGLPSWRATGVTNTSTRILLQSNATTIKRASLGSIVSPHSSSNGHCKSERAVPVGWYARTGKDTTTPVRLRRTAPIK